MEVQNIETAGRSPATSCGIYSIGIELILQFLVESIVEEKELLNHKIRYYKQLVSTLQEEVRIEKLKKKQEEVERFVLRYHFCSCSVKEKSENGLNEIGNLGIK